jgi:hypothetical protein
MNSDQFKKLLSDLGSCVLIDDRMNDYFDWERAESLLKEFIGLDTKKISDLEAELKAAREELRGEAILNEIGRADCSSLVEGIRSLNEQFENSRKLSSEMTNHWWKEMVEQKRRAIKAESDLAAARAELATANARADALGTAQRGAIEMCVGSMRGELEAARAEVARLREAARDFMGHAHYPGEQCSEDKKRAFIASSERLAGLLSSTPSAAQPDKDAEIERLRKALDRIEDAVARSYRHPDTAEGFKERTQRLNEIKDIVLLALAESTEAKPADEDDDGPMVCRECKQELVDDARRDICHDCAKPDEGSAALKSKPANQEGKA